MFLVKSISVLLIRADHDITEIGSISEKCSAPENRKLGSLVQELLLVTNVGPLDPSKMLNINKAGSNR